MATLRYSLIASLDGYVADRDGRFDWAEPDDEVHAAVNELERPVGTHLYGRRLYETMAPWETLPLGPDDPAVARDFQQLWRDVDKVVYSRTLAAPTTPRTRLEREFDPDAVRALVAAADRDVSIGGPGLATSALRAGLVGELSVWVVPVVVGGGTPMLPDGLRLDLTLLDERRFAGGTVLLHYRVEDRVSTAS